MANRLPFKPRSSSQDREEIRLTGKVIRVIFSSEETMYTVASVKTNQGEIVMVGPMGRLGRGEELTAWGMFRKHPTYGRQLQVSRYRIELPSTETGIEAYLGSGLIPGLGPAKATDIVAKFGSKALDVIREEPELLLEIKGIGKKTLIKITKAVNDRSAMEGLLVFLKGHGLSTGLAAKLYKKYGDSALARVREDPYLLALQVSGIGFKKADELARKIGLAEDSPQRIAGGLRHVLTMAADDGHLYLTYEGLSDQSTKLLGVDNELVKTCLAEMMASGRLVYEDINDDFQSFEMNNKAIFLPGLHRAEVKVFERIKALNAISGRVDPNRAAKLIDQLATEANGFELAQGQRLAVEMGLIGKVSVITGGPGTGKTTLIQALIRLYNSLDISFALAAPTGRAAQRLKETTGHSAATLHRLLAYTPDKGFQHNAGNPLNFDALVVDEASMIDISLMAHLVEALDDQTMLVLVGDVDQLPPVGPGQVLEDMIDSGSVGVVRLTEVFRQAAQSRIVVNAHRIRDGLMPLADSSDDFYFIRQEDSRRAAEMIVEMVSERMPRSFGYDPMLDIQVLSPMRRGLCGVEGLNLKLQQTLNPNGELLARDRFRVGDKVIQTRNNYDKGVFNGDVGVVLGKGKAGAVQVEMYGRPVVYSDIELDELDLAYCLSIHKSQGSEYRAVIIPLMREHRIMMGRNLIYTALTRAKETGIIIGSPLMLKMAVAEVRQVRRNTLLNKRLGGLESTK